MKEYPPLFVGRIKFDSPEPFKIREITDNVNDLIRRAEIENGFALINSLHTTLGLLITETKEPKLFDDVKNFLLTEIPEDGRSFNATESYKAVYPVREIDYLHRCQDNPLCDGKDIGYNAASHLRALFTHPSLHCAVEEGRLRLGKFQGLAAIELDGRDGSDGINPVRRRVIEVRITPAGRIISLDE